MHLTVYRVCAQYYIVRSHLYYDERRVHFTSCREECDKSYFFTDNESVYITETKMEQNPLMMCLAKMKVDMDGLQNFDHVGKTSNQSNVCDVCTKISCITTHTVIWKSKDRFHIGETCTPGSDAIRLHLRICVKCRKFGEEMLNRSIMVTS